MSLEQDVTRRSELNQSSSFCRFDEIENGFFVSLSFFPLSLSLHAPRPSNSSCSDAPLFFFLPSRVDVLLRVALVSFVPHAANEELDGDDDQAFSAIDSPTY